MTWNAWYRARQKDDWKLVASARTYKDVVQAAYAMGFESRHLNIMRSGNHPSDSITDTVDIITRNADEQHREPRRLHRRHIEELQDK